MLQKHRVLAVTKCDILDEELLTMLKEELENLTSLPVVFISSVTGFGIEDLKDLLWQELNSESNKIQGVIAEETLVHRDRDIADFADLEDIPDDEEETQNDDDEMYDAEDLEDFEYV